MTEFLTTEKAQFLSLFGALGGAGTAISVFQAFLDDKWLSTTHIMHI